jgi:predicted RNA-binding protein (virulence factor B family)
MAEIGKVNRLKVKRVRDYGVHLDGGDLGDIILKHREVPEKCQPGDEVEVFIFQDRDDRLRATTQRPSVTVGQFAKLRVVASNPGGAFLDWGLDKDLFAPMQEQLFSMERGESYFVFVYLDAKSNRITASSRLDKFLSQQAPEYKEGEEVDLVIYDHTDLGYKALVNLSHCGMIYENEVFQELDLGQQLKGYVKKVRGDLKIDLSLQQSGYQGVDDIAQDILNVINEHGGMIGVTDKSPPEEIYALFGVSKKSFKKAIGGLYKKRLIIIEPKGIKLVK